MCIPPMHPKYKHLNWELKKLKGSDIEWLNLCGHQVTHFVGCIRSLNVDNSFCNHKNVKTTFDMKLIIFVSSTKERKTQVRWVVVVGQKTEKRTKTNKIFPNGSLMCSQAP